MIRGSGKKGKVTFEEDTVGFLVQGAGKGMPPSVGDITGETRVLDLLRSGGVMQWAVLNSSPELRENVRGWGEGKGVGVGNKEN